MMIVVAIAASALLWWLVKRIWLVKEATEAEPPPAPGTPLRPREPSLQAAGPDPVDEAIDESFPASDPPSYAGARDHNELSP